MLDILDERFPLGPYGGWVRPGASGFLRSVLRIYRLPCLAPLGISRLDQTPQGRLGYLTAFQSRTDYWLESLVRHECGGVLQVILASLMMLDFLLESPFGLHQ